MLKVALCSYKAAQCWLKGRTFSTHKCKQKQFVRDGIKELHFWCAKYVIHYKAILMDTMLPYSINSINLTFLVSKTF